MQWKVFITSALCWMGCIAETLGMSYVIPAAECDLRLNTFKKGLLTSIPFLGIALTSHLWGFLADVYGRRTIIIVSVIGSLVLSLTASLVPIFEAMVVIRLFSGMR